MTFFFCKWKILYLAIRDLPNEYINLNLISSPHFVYKGVVSGNALPFIVKKVWISIKFICFVQTRINFT
ncbi:MAG: hypothetical protein K0R54_4191 [Clostridiaceae bacterium]|jgi:hypothetical protein|nr:hypothetical protein [Clostridiaceae bacterium]